jgi:nitrate reductase NapE component
MTTVCLLCETLNNDDFERCSLCKTEPELALRVVTESQRWVSLTLVMVVFLVLASSVSIDFYVTYRVFLHSGNEAEDSFSDAFALSAPPEGEDVSPARSDLAATRDLLNGRQIVDFVRDFFIIGLWLVISVGFVGVTMYQAKKATMWVCCEVMRKILRGKIARNEYISAGFELLQIAHLSKARANSRGML